MFLHVYVNFFNFLLDLVEAVRTQLVLNVGCKASLKKFTNRQAARWLDPMIKFTKMHLKGPGPAQHSLRDKFLFSEKCFMGWLWWLLLASILPWRFLCRPPSTPGSLSAQMLVYLMSYCVCYSILVRKSQALPYSAIPTTS